MSTRLLATPSDLRKAAIPIAIRDRGRSAAILYPQLRPSQLRSHRLLAECRHRASGCSSPRPATSATGRSWTRATRLCAKHGCAMSPSATCVRKPSPPRPTACGSSSRDEQSTPSAESTNWRRASGISHERYHLGLMQISRSESAIRAGYTALGERRGVRGIDLSGRPPVARSDRPQPPGAARRASR